MLIPINNNIANIGYAFNRLVSKALHDSAREYNKESGQLITFLKNRKLGSYQHKLDLTEWMPRSVQSFQLESVYPGLLVGLGNKLMPQFPGKNELTNDFKLGFHFDYSSGLPSIPGSGVKGKLRSFFPGRYTDPVKRKEVYESIKGILENLIDHKDDNIKIDPGRVLDTETKWRTWIYNLEYMLFEGSSVDVNEKGEVSNKTRCLNKKEQDVFFHAFPVPRNGKTDTKFLEEETITPHDHPLKNPIPLRLLKVSPNVDWKFQFKFNDEFLKPNEKVTFFKTLLIIGGAGAKTRSGFGAFTDDKERKRLEQMATSAGDGYLSLPGASKISKVDRGNGGNIGRQPPPRKPDFDPEKLPKDHVKGIFFKQQPGNKKVKFIRFDHPVSGQETVKSISWAADEPLNSKVIIKIEWGRKKVIQKIVLIKWL